MWNFALKWKKNHVYIKQDWFWTKELANM
jgi:hypothetical protein